MERAQTDDQCQHPGCECPRPATILVSWHIIRHTKI